MTEPTRVASQARAKLMALTGNIRENLLQQFLSITTVTFTNTLLHSEDVTPARAALQQCLHSFNTKENTSTSARGSQKSQKHGILSYINKTQGEIKSPTGERIRAGLSDAVRSFLWTVTGPWGLPQLPGSPERAAVLWRHLLQGTGVPGGEGDLWSSWLALLEVA